MPAIDVAMPRINAHIFQRGSWGDGQATAPRKPTLIADTR